MGFTAKNKALSEAEQSWKDEVDKYAYKINKSGKQVYVFIRPLKIYIGGGIRLQDINEGPYKTGDTIVSSPNFKIDWKNNTITYRVLSEQLFKAGNPLLESQVSYKLKATDYLIPTNTPYMPVYYWDRGAAKKKKKESAGLVVICDGKIFLVHAPGADKTGTYSIPKGKMEDGEKPATTAIREFEEETGLKLKGRANPYLPFFTINTPVRNLHFFIVELDSCGDLGMTSDEVDAKLLQKSEVDWAGFVPFAKAYHKMSPYQLPILQIAENFNKLKPSTVVIEWETDNGKYDFVIKEAGQAQGFAHGKNVTSAEFTKALAENGVPPEYHSRIFENDTGGGELPVVYKMSKNYDPNAGLGKCIVAAWVCVPILTGIFLYAYNKKASNSK
jgi:8-oxo-dGTP pyrophosphatase MutT (NUDIX family)